MKVEFSEHAIKALISGEKEGAVCSFCGGKLPKDHYLLLSAWRLEAKELMSPRMRFCAGCWGKIEHVVYSQVRQLKMMV